MILLSALILLFGSASYIVGIKKMFEGKYLPSVFSRAVWLMLSAISFAGVVSSGSTKSSILLAGVFLAGNAAICLASFWRGTKELGMMELICFFILMLSGIVWFVFDSPLISLAVSLLAHFVGGVPTYKKVWNKPQTESAGFWSLFFVASVLSIVASWGQPLSLLIFPIYFAVFDGAMTILALRRVKV